MYCPQCGNMVAAGSRFCTNCGTKLDGVAERSQPTAGVVNEGRNFESGGNVGGSGRVGYSTRINDPFFARHLKSSGRGAVIGSVIMAVVVFVGYAVYGIKNNDTGWFGPAIGLSIMFLLIGAVSVLRQKKSKTWDGVVVNKKAKQKTRSDDDETEEYMQYTIYIRDERGKKHRMVFEDDQVRYDYFQVGDKVRHHAGLMTYEKYDKSQDSIVFCNVCGAVNNIDNDKCSRCKALLLN